MLFLNRCASLQRKLAAAWNYYKPTNKRQIITKQNHSCYMYFAIKKNIPAILQSATCQGCNKKNNKQVQCKHTVDESTAAQI
jgi:hypothetical protein